MRLRLAFAVALALTTAAVVWAQAQQPPQPAQPGPYPTTLYQMPDVNKSLNLSTQQVDRLNQLTQQTQATYRDRYGQLGNLQPAERQARMQELNRQYSTDWMRGARDVLNENQLNRYQQLNWQYGGFNSLTDPEVARRLNLTTEQRNALSQQLEWSSGRMRDIDRQMATDPNLGRQQYRDYMREYDTRFNRLLTEEQQRAWTDMTGARFTFQPGVPSTPPR